MFWLTGFGQVYVSYQNREKICAIENVFRKKKKEKNRIRTHSSHTWLRPQFFRVANVTITKNIDDSAEKKIHMCVYLFRRNYTLCTFFGLYSLVVMKFFRPQTNNNGDIQYSCQYFYNKISIIFTIHCVTYNLWHCNSFELGTLFVYIVDQKHCAYDSFNPVRRGFLKYL